MNPSDETPNEYHNRKEDCYYDSEHDRLLGERVIADFTRGFQYAVVVKQKFSDSDEWDNLSDAFDIETMEVGEKEYYKGTFYAGAYFEGYIFGKHVMGNKISKADYADYYAQYTSYKESFWDYRPDIDNLLDDKGEKE